MLLEKILLREKEVALYHSYDNMWAWQIQPQSSAFDHRKEVEKFYSPFFSKNINVDVISTLDDLADYQILVLPIIFLVDGDWIEKVESFVADGGKLILSYRSGVKDENNIVTKETLPGIFKDLAGIEINEYESLQTGQNNCIRYQGQEYKTTVWSDLINLDGAKSLAEYTQNFYAGQTAITKNNYGDGEVYYIGCSPEKELLEKLYEQILATTNINIYPTPQGIELIHKKGKNDDYLIALNHTSEKTKVTLPQKSVDIISKAELKEIELKEFDGRLLKLK